MEEASHNNIQKFEAVDLDSLKAGMLMDRALYLYLESNNRYIQMVKPLHPLEDRIYTKLHRIGKVFATEQGIEKRFPELVRSAENVRVLMNDLKMSPFENNRALRGLTKWLVPLVLSQKPDPMPCLFFIHRVFEVPKTETLLFVSNISVDMYERSLKVAAVSALIALWLGYSQSEYISQLVEAIFCEEIGLYAAEYLPQLSNNLSDRKLLDSHRGFSLEFIKAGQVPGVAQLDHRFRCHLERRMQSQVSGDEIYDIVEYARWVSGFSNDFGENILSTRISKKLHSIFGNEMKPSSGEDRIAA